MTLLLINNYVEVTNQFKNNIFQMVGASEFGITSEQIGAHLLKGISNEEFIHKGKEILEPFGYTDNYKTFFDKNLQGYIIHIVIINSILFLAFRVGCLLIHRHTIHRNDQELDQIYHILSKFRQGEYNTNLSKMEETSRSKLYELIDSLGNTLSIHEENLKKEKEITKSIVTDISHQLKTPIASLKIYFTILSEDTLDKLERAEFMDRFSDQLKRLEGLCEALIQISRLETGMVTIVKEQKNIFDTVVAAINHVFIKAEEKNIVIELDSSMEKAIENLMIPHDVKWTIEAITNVLENGIKYSNSDTTITISMVKLSNFLRIEIEDEGIGIQKEEINHIFQRFYRGKSDRVKNIEGSGVGLYLTRTILERQGGNITVSQSKTTSKLNGSKFILQLSLA